MATKRSPLSRETREAIEQATRDEYLACVALASDELVSRDRHFDEIRSSSTLPQSLDVYLPGREAWQDVWDDMQESFRAEREPFVSSGGSFHRVESEQQLVLTFEELPGRPLPSPPTPPLAR